MGVQSKGDGDSVKVTCDFCRAENVVPARAMNHKVRCASCREVFRAVSTVSDPADEQESSDWFSSYMQGDAAPDRQPQPQSKSRSRPQQKVAKKASPQNKPRSAFIPAVILIFIGVALGVGGIAQANHADKKLDKPTDLRIESLVENGMGNESYVRVLGAREEDYFAYEGQENQALQIVTGRVWQPMSVYRSPDREIVLVTEKKVEGQLVDTMNLSSRGSGPLAGVLSQGGLHPEAARLLKSEYPNLDANSVYVLRLGRPIFKTGIVIGLAIALAGLIVSLVGLNKLRKAIFKKSDIDVRDSSVLSRQF